MSRRIITILGLILLAVTPMSAQKEFTLDNLIPGGKSYARFVPQGKSQLQWMGNHYIYQRGDSLYIQRREKEKCEGYITLAALNHALEATPLKPLTRLPYISRTGSDFIDFQAQSHYCRYNVEKEEITHLLPLEKGDTNLDWEPTQQQLAVTNGANLYRIDAAGNRSTVALSMTEGISNGMAGVHRNEFGIGKGTFWSPNGERLAYYQLDQRAVSQYPLVDVSRRVATLNNIRYPMAGMASEKVKVAVYSFEKGKTIYLKTDSAFAYQTNICWSPNGKTVYVQELNRAQDHTQLVAYDAATGRRMQVLFEKRDAHYVEPQNPLFFLNDEEFIYQSREDGYNHLYLYNTTGELLQQLTHGAWEVTALNGYDKERKVLFFTSTEASPLEDNLYALSLKKGTWRRLTPAEGMHSVQLSPDFDYLIDSYTNHAEARTIELIAVNRNHSRNLYRAANPYKEYNVPEVTVGTIKAADGETDLYYRLVTPINFDPTKKYPVVIYVYGGPHAQMITNRWRWGASGWDTYMAQRGYVMFTLDSRGSDRRGRDFEQVIHRHVGINEAADQMEGVTFLQSLPYVDGNRIGVHGWSYGGFMTTNLMLRYPETFKVGVAGGAVVDWKYYEVMYGERYMDTPQENPEGYKESSLLTHADKLQGRLKLIHCDNDPVVVWQHTLAFLKRCVEVGTYPDYAIYPGHEHNVIGIERVHLHEAITRYFDDYLKGER